MTGIQSVSFGSLSITQGTQSTQQNRWQQVLNSVAQTLGIDPSKLATAIKNARQDTDGDQDGSQGQSTSQTQSDRQAFLNNVAQQLGIQPSDLQKAFQSAMSAIGGHHHHHHQSSGSSSTSDTQLSLILSLTNGLNQTSGSQSSTQGIPSDGTSIDVPA